ncbi:transcriptional regulator [Sphingorhabdus lutea]|uniref:Transcriptional regulator n=1 Tax=Sphingorhabdus lutea TaxID=1913578 RepID=A0A1L3JDS7_9SPHN|nr:helix-turn-helix domain-containing protein [Sphingorhabdus lutea]APG63298.1 transcriptional regulator [Sphingorhabdus lutea]
MGGLREKLSMGDDCGLPLALDSMGEKWSFMILRASFNGVRHFEEFLTEMGIARNILANRLTRLTANGILQRHSCPHDRRKVEYLLTDKGLALLPAMIALRQWGEEYGGDIISNPVLVDAEQRRPIRKIKLISEDGRELALHDLCWVNGDDIGNVDNNVSNISKTVA